MKRLIILALAFFTLQTAQAQLFSYGLRVGGATTSIDAEPQTILNDNGVDSLTLAITNSKFGVHVGGFIRLKLASFYVQPEVLFNTASYEYTRQDLTGVGATEILKDRFNTLDIPIMVGAKFSAFRAQAGVIGSVLISNINDFETISETFDRQLSNMTWGWQAGVGLDVGKFLIDIKYEGSFDRFGNGVMFYGNEYNFDARLNRFVVTIGFEF